MEKKVKKDKLYSKREILDKLFPGDAPLPPVNIDKEDPRAMGGFLAVEALKRVVLK
ncbi:MAG: hypothetical protein KAJ18_03525 [Candidatus Omnitrophica bacterium]|nr:hypothetical protein [Candidatus Omnitrophota bacterium]